MDEFPYLNHFSNRKKEFRLLLRAIAPKAITAARRVRHPRGIIAGGPETILDATDGDARLILDFGEQVVGKVELHILAHGDSEVRFYYGEDDKEACRTTEYTAGWYKLPTDEFRVSQGRHKLVNHGRRAFRYLHLLVPEGSARVTLLGLQAESRRYPVEERGSFHCSDHRLNRIWKMSRHTTALCMQQYYEDGVKRDGLLWIGDYRIQFLCNWYCFGDTELAR